MGMTVDQLQGKVTPEMRKATWRLPRSGAAAGTAANFALHLARC